MSSQEVRGFWNNNLPKDRKLYNSYITCTHPQSINNNSIDNKEGNFKMVDHAIYGPGRIRKQMKS